MLDDVKRPFERLHAQVLQRQAKLQNVIIQGQDFQLSLREALSTLEEFERGLAQQEPVSAKCDVVTPQKEDHEVSNIRAVYTRENKPRITQSAAYLSRELSHLYEHGLYKKLVRDLRKPRTCFLCRLYEQFAAYIIRGLFSLV